MLLDLDTIWETHIVCFESQHFKCRNLLANLKYLLTNGELTSGNALLSIYNFYKKTDSFRVDFKVYNSYRAGNKIMGLKESLLKRRTYELGQQ